EQLLSRLTADVEAHALLAGVVPPVVQTAIRVDLVVNERTAPPSRAPRGRLDLDHSRAAVGQELARPLVAAIGQLDHRATVVHATHLALPFTIRPDAIPQAKATHLESLLAAYALWWPASGPRSDGGALQRFSCCAQERALEGAAPHKEMHHADANETARYDCPGSWLLGDGTKLGALDHTL